MTNIRSVWDKNREDDKNKKDDKKKYEMFSQGGGQSGTGVLRPVKQDVDDLKNLQRMQQSQNIRSDQKLDRALIIYKNGYKIGEDGEFKKIENQQHKQFMEQIKRGELPMQLQNYMKEKYGNVNDVGVNVVDRTKEEYKPPPEPKFKAFQGQGNTLGNNNNNNVNSSLSECEEKEINVDDKEETIRVQLILNNGKRKTEKLNSSCTVLELYAHVKFLTKYNGKFQLLAGFPPKPLTNGNENVKSAGLNGARITMKNV